MKIIIIASLIALALAENFNLEFEEGGQKYTEGIKVDTAEQVEEISVPKHLDRMAIDVLKDFKQGLKAKKVISKKICYISPIDKDDEPPRDTEMSMKLVKSFPSARYQIIKKSYLPISEMTAGQVGAKIAAHCAGHQMLYAAMFEGEDINDAVTKMFRAKKAASGKFRRDLSLRTFTACRDDSTNVVETCPQDKLASKCRFRRTDGNDCMLPLKNELSNLWTLKLAMAHIGSEETNSVADDIKMKFIILASLIALALAEKFHMEFEEGGQKYTEDIKVDTTEQVEEISVPKHLDRMAIDVLKDFKRGLKAKKVLSKKICYISTIDADDEPPRQMEMSMKMTNSKFPTSRFNVIKKSYLPISEMTAQQVGEKIAAHCAGHQMLYAAMFEGEHISDAVTKMFRAKKAGGKFKRDLTLRTFTACRDDSTNVVESCAPDKLSANCRFRRNDGNDCMYQINCLMGPTGFVCKGTHVFNSLTCCDFSCSS
eukprot:gene18727-20616_t